MRIELLRDRCVGHGQCNAVAPTIYELDQHGYCEPAHGDIPASAGSNAVDGAKSCPESAIIVVSDAS